MLSQLIHVYIDRGSRDNIVGYRLNAMYLKSYVHPVLCLCSGSCYLKARVAYVAPIVFESVPIGTAAFKTASLFFPSGGFLFHLGQVQRTLLSRARRPHATLPLPASPARCWPALSLTHLTPAALTCWGRRRRDHAHAVLPNPAFFVSRTPFSFFCYYSGKGTSNVISLGRNPDSSKLLVIPALWPVIGLDPQIWYDSTPWTTGECNEGFWSVLPLKTNQMGRENLFFS